MNITKLVSLVSKASNGKDDFEKGAVGSNGYGFVFIDLNSEIPYVTFKGSSKLFSAGSQRDALKNYKKSGIYTMDLESDLLLIGSVKTLVPALKLGGYEELFDVWVLVKTPEGRMFPIRFYYGQSGLSIGGWKLRKNYIDTYTGEKVFPKDFEEIINFNPSNFTDFDRNLFLDALEFALKKVPISDFWGIYRHDIGATFMGVVEGEPRVRDSDKFRDRAFDKDRDRTFPIAGKDIKL